MHPAHKLILLKGVGVPAGYSRTTFNGDPVTYNGSPVFDDGRNFFVRSA